MYTFVCMYVCMCVYIYIYIYTLSLYVLPSPDTREQKAGTPAPETKITRNLKMKKKQA